MTNLEEQTWIHLVRAIRRENCTPFLGAGIAFGKLPMGIEIAKNWSLEYDYPFSDGTNLIQVAQYLSVREGHLYPKYAMLDLIRSVRPNFQDDDDPYRILASLPFPIFITTNYDDFMYQALQLDGKTPGRIVCPWWTSDLEIVEEHDGREIMPSSNNPVIYHFHGHTSEVDSLVLTQQDYVSFLVKLADKNNITRLLPRWFRTAMSRSTLVFIGYSLMDWTFQVIFRSLRETIASSSQATKHIAVQVPPHDMPDIKREQAQEYLAAYMGQNMNVEIFWGSAEEFTKQLRDKYKEYADTSTVRT